MADFVVKTMRPSVSLKQKREKQEGQPLRQRQKKHDESDDDETLITGEEAIRIYDLLQNPPQNQEKDRIITRAMEEFPNPDRTTEIDIDISDEE